MREAQKVERLWFPSAPFRLLFRVPPKANQLRLAWLYLQMESFQPLSHLPEKTLCVFSVLKARQEVIRKAKVEGLSPTLAAKASLEPKVQHVVQIHVRSNPRHLSALRNTLVACSY